jgi:hypothetical protein
MRQEKTKPMRKAIRRVLFLLLLAGAVIILFLTGSVKIPANAFSDHDSFSLETGVTKVLTTETLDTERIFTLDDLLSNIDNFVATPKGGIDWKIFGQTLQKEYAITDAEGMQWSGVRPEFSEDLKRHDGTEILIQGYMFPLGQEEKQPLFLLGPFPLSCPYHYHVTPNLIIEVHAKTAIVFSYDAVNLRGKLELVPRDDEYNVFYRLKDAEIVQ